LISCAHIDFGDAFFRGKTDHCDTIVGRTNDPDLRQKLELITGTNNFIHPYSDHSGRIIFARKNHRKSTIKSGDAFIIESDSPAQAGIIRTRDCVPILGEVYGFLLGIHISNQTEFGYDSRNFKQPITKRVFVELIEYHYGMDLTNCQVYIGPCIAGIMNDGCECYGYTENHSQRDGTRLLRLIQTHHPDVNLEGLFFWKDNQDKIYFRWGALIVEILQSLGIPRENIHTNYNYCTRCSNGWWSTRAFNHTTDPDEKTLFAEVGPSNLAWINRQ